MNERDTLARALADCAAIGGEWLRHAGRERTDPAKMEELGRLVPDVLAAIMTRAADALEAAGYDVPAEVDAAVDRIGRAQETDWH